MSLPEGVRSALWNVDPERLDLERDANLIISTVLPRGGEEALVWLFRTYGADRIRKVVVEDARGLRTLPGSALRLWLRVLAPGLEVAEPSTARERWAPRRFEQLARREAEQAARGPARPGVT
jgi:hypothetical protein